MAPPRPWIVTPHQPVQKLEDNLRVVTSGLPRGNMTRTMMIARRTDGRLVFYNAVPLEEPAMKELEAWGTPGFLFVPNAFHRLDIHAFKQRYPELKVVSPAPIRAKVSEVLPVELVTSEVAPDGDVEFVTLRGTKVEEAVMIVRSGARTSFCFGDAFFNLRAVPGFDGFIFKLIGSVGGPKVTPLAKLAIVGDKKALAAHYHELAATPGLARLIPSHGEVVDQNAAAILKQVADRI